MHARIRGVVQGVSYRASAAARARELGLSGWVRNRNEGSVELIVNLTSAVCNLLSGVILDYLGYTALGLLGAALALVPLLVVARQRLRPSNDPVAPQA